MHTVQQVAAAHSPSISHPLPILLNRWHCVLASPSVTFQLPQHMLLKTKRGPSMASSELMGLLVVQARRAAHDGKLVT
jgi:hypothetical protein